MLPTYLPRRNNKKAFLWRTIEGLLSRTISFLDLSTSDKQFWVAPHINLKITRILRRRSSRKKIFLNCRSSLASFSFYFLSHLKQFDFFTFNSLCPNSRPLDHESSPVCQTTIMVWEYEKIVATKLVNLMGGSPGLVVMGRDSRSEGRGFESRHHILDGQFFTYICCKNCNDV